MIGHELPRHVIVLRQPSERYNVGQRVVRPRDRWQQHELRLAPRGGLAGRRSRGTLVKQSRPKLDCGRSPRVVCAVLQLGRCYECICSASTLCSWVTIGEWMIVSADSTFWVDPRGYHLLVSECPLSAVRQTERPFLLALGERHQQTLY